MEERPAVRVTPDARCTAHLARPRRTPRRRRPLGLAFAALGLGALLASLSLAVRLHAGEPEVGPSSLEPATTGGVVALERALAKLSTHKRLLVVGAHPDDEDTSLLSLVARGMGGEAAYLSLSRGEGGQNLIGPELGVGLGLLRSRELLAARSIDGARQFFTRAYDFGYTRSLDETLTLWPRDVLREDVARILRRFRPQVLVSVFPGQPVRTHGQHQAAGVVTHEVFATVGKAGAFPQLDAEGLPPWQPLALYRSTYFDRNATSLEMPVGTVDPLSGKSIFQLAMASRSQHRSQDMGNFQPLGSRSTRLAWVAGAGGTEATSVFEGIDTSLPAMLATLPEGGPEGEPRRAAAGLLRDAEHRARATRATLVPTDLGAAVPALGKILDDLRQARQRILDAPYGEPATALEARAVARILGEKVAVAQGALADAASLAVDVFADRETLVAGEDLGVQALVWNAGGAPVELLGVSILSPADWPVRTAPAQDDENRRGFFGIEPTLDRPGTLRPDDLYQGDFRVTVPSGTEPTVPYFLHRPLRGSLYDWSGVPKELLGEPFAPPLLRARFMLRIAGVETDLEREVVWRFRDQARGEVRRPLRVVPAVEVAVDPDLLVWPTGERRPRSLEVTLTSHRASLGDGPSRGRLEVAVPEGWPQVPPRPFELTAANPATTVSVEVQPPERFSAGRFTLGVTAALADGSRMGLAVPLVDYPHIRPTPWPQPAAVTVSAADIRLPRLSRVGYIRGASDRVPEFLREIGVPLEMLTAKELTEGSLDGFDAVIVGSRAYETDPALVQANGRLLDYVRGGGLLLVQYQQYAFVRGGFAPFPLDISRPHDRVTDETAPVRLLVPGHPVFHVPNEIGAADWKGWVQERGLYFAGTWDDAYTPLLAMADPGMDEVDGSLLIAHPGKGTYIYTGLAFFRQLPAGVPGAYRLFANLLGLASDRTGREPAR